MEINVYYNGKIFGKSFTYMENNQLILDFSCPFEDGKIYKLFYNIGDLVFPLGTLLKNNNKFYIKKPLNIKKVGIDGKNISYCHLEQHKIGQKNTPPLPFNIDQFTPLPFSVDTPDHALQHCLLSPILKGYYFENSLYLCCEFKNDASFLFSPFFCLVTIIKCEKGCFAVLKLDQQNNPTFLK